MAFWIFVNLHKEFFPEICGTTLDTEYRFQSPWKFPFLWFLFLIFLCMSVFINVPNASLNKFYFPLLEIARLSFCNQIKPKIIWITYLLCNYFSYQLLPREIHPAFNLGQHFRDHFVLPGIFLTEHTLEKANGT